MNLYQRLKDILCGDSGPPLRNKAGGMAYIKNTGPGTDPLANRIVKTVRVNGRAWEIEPPQEFVCTRAMLTVRNTVALPGQTVTCIAIVDECLEPIRDVGDNERDESLAYLPPVPPPKLIPLPVREMRPE